MTETLLQSFSLISQPQPLPRTRYQDSQCWFEISGHLAIFNHAEHGTHGFTVQCGPNTVLHAYGTTDGSGGAVLNLRGDFLGRFEGPYVHEQQLPADLRVLPEDALIVTSTTTAPGSRGSLPYPGGRSRVDEMLPVVFVSWKPGPEFFRPPAIGDGPIARFFRSMPVPLAAMNLAKLPQVINIDALGVDWTAWGNERPTIARSETLFSKFCGEVTSGWNTDGFSPDHQNVGYGREQARIASDSFCLLASKVSNGAKRQLAQNMCQRGFDLLGAWADGRARDAQANGGHGNGRKALIVLFGWLIGCEEIRYVSRSLGGPSFAEDFQYVAGTRFDGGTSIWRYNSTGDWSQDWAKPPEQWGPTWVYQVNGYFQHCCGSQIGTSLFMRLTGNVEAMNPHLDTMVTWFMSKPRDWLRGPNCWIEWGKAYGGDFCEAAWRKHA